MIPPEYFNMYRTLEAATLLDPYNADPYYFANAIFTWDAGRVVEVNKLLEYGMNYRTWDSMMPFFAGFNAGYFLKDFEKASRHMARAAEISGSPGIAHLASRYFYEAGELSAAIEFLTQIERMAPSVREAEFYRFRKEALQAVSLIQTALGVYRQRYGQPPDSLQDLVTDGVLDLLPVDPYGGKFFVDNEGKVRSTSNLKFPHIRKQQ